MKNKPKVYFCMNARTGKQYLVQSTKGYTLMRFHRLRCIDTFIYIDGDLCGPMKEINQKELI